jgi:hypothetical protein
MHTPRSAAELKHQCIGTGTMDEVCSLREKQQTQERQCVHPNVDMCGAFLIHVRCSSKWISRSLASHMPASVTQALRAYKRLVAMGILVTSIK